MKLRTLLFIFVIFFLTGCQSGYFSQVDFHSVLKIDTHVHIDSDRGLFEKQAIEDNFKLVTINVDVADSASVNHQLSHALLSAKRYPGTVFYTATFHFDTAGWKSQDWSKQAIENLTRAIACGAVSVKLWKNIGMTVTDRNGKFIMVDNPEIKPVIDFIKGAKLAVTGHLGEPRNCWLPIKEMTIRGDSSYYVEHPQYHMFAHPEYPTYDEQISARDHLLELHPDLRFVGCHLGSLEWNVDELTKRFNKYPNFAVDMAARISHLQYQSVSERNKVREFCIKYQDRLLYGTDMSDEGTQKEEELVRSMHKIWSEDWRYFTSEDELTSVHFKGKFKGLHLPREVVEKIYSKNAIKWYHLPANK